jgi:hypothetical protein
MIADQKVTNQDSERYSKIMLELQYLRQTDYDGFMDKLYEALTGEFKDSIRDVNPVSEKKQALWTMIHHFEKTEDYEKCAKLKGLVTELNEVENA